MAHGLYQQVVGRSKPRVIDDGDKISPAEDALIKQQISDWLRSPVTGNLIRSFAQEVDELEAEARNLALSYHTHGNHVLIISKLVKADTLRKVIERHGTGQ